VNINEIIRISDGTYQRTTNLADFFLFLNEIGIVGLHRPASMTLHVMTSRMIYAWRLSMQKWTLHQGWINVEWINVEWINVDWLLNECWIKSTSPGTLSDPTSSKINTFVHPIGLNMTDTLQHFSSRNSQAQRKSTF